MKLWLFDVDGVLVQPGGYHAALKATVTHFARQMGLGDTAAPDDATIELFEACGITSEWDSSAMCVGALLVEAWRDHPQPPASLEAALTEAPRPVRADYASLARRVARSRRPGERPPATTLRLLLNDGVGNLKSVLTNLLENARSFPRSPTMVAFQHFALGSGAYARTYGLTPTFRTASLLAAHDRPALSPESRDRIHGLIAAGRLGAAVYTARPSLPPRELDPRPSGYSPEAEIAARLNGLSGLPLIGYGHVSWLAAQVGEHPDAFLKPSPVQALAAIGAAATGRERHSLLAAHALAVRGELRPPLEELTGEDVAVTVFEDSSGGVQAVREAAERLRTAGVRIKVAARGIAAGDRKRAALEREVIRVWGDVNAAIRET